MNSDHDSTSNALGDSDDDLISSITPDVMRVLQSVKFFARLDDFLCPSSDSVTRRSCGGNFQISESILRSQDFDQEAIADVIDVLKSQGGCCDCEVLYNVAESSRLKAKYWKARAEGLEPSNTHDATE